MNDRFVYMQSLINLYPKIADEWHPTKNGDLKPENFTRSSNKKVWWKCPKGEDHDWEATVSSRSKGSGCPFCSGRRVNKDNNLAVLSPDLSNEWHPTKNGDLKPEDVKVGSHKKVWWKCPKEEDHDWETSVYIRSEGCGCPFCAGKRVSKDNNLAVLSPDLSKEWHPTKNGDLKPEDVTVGSHEKVWWKCPKGEDHDWEAPVYSRSKGSGCPFCAGQRASKDNNLAVLSPDLSKEWHPTKNGDLKPEDVKVGSHKKVWWKCPKEEDHDWETSVNVRSRGSGCPKCTNQTSEPEIRILTELMFLFDDVVSRYKINGREVDIFIPLLNLAIEFDGRYYHEGKEAKDREKNIFLKSKDIFLLRIRQDPLTRLSKTDIILKNKVPDKKDLNEIVDSIKKILSINTIKNLDVYKRSDDFLNEHIYREYISYFPDPFPDRSFLNLSPDQSKEWHYEKNYPLKPENFSISSNKKVWWKCLKGEDHEWKASLANRSKGKGCPFCAGQRVSKDNNLAVLFPDLSKQWHYEKNYPLKPENFTVGSSKKVWWKCLKGEDHEWETSVVKRFRGDGCPFCSGRRVNKDNNLAVLSPDLSNEWHPTKNGDLKPENFTISSGKKVWWKCPNGKDHEWEAAIYSRSGGSGCPLCARKRTTEQDLQMKLFPYQ